MRSEVLVSVVIPTYNKGLYIEKTVQSVLNQTYKNLEIILVDNFSDPNTISVLDRVINLSPKIRILKLQSNLGPSSARNIGINNANGKYIFFLDGDDIMLREKVHKQVKFMNENPEVALSLTSYIIFNEFRKFNQHVSFNKVGEALKGWHSMTGFGALVESTGCINRDFLTPNLLFSQEYFGCEGLKFVYDWNEKLAVRIIRSPLTLYRLSNSQLHHNKSRIRQDMLKLNFEKLQTRREKFIYERFQKAYFYLDNQRKLTVCMQIKNIAISKSFFVIAMSLLILKRNLISRIRCLKFTKLIHTYIR